MVKIRGALYSNSAHGWLGGDQYGRLGMVSNPYPIGLHFKNKYHAFYYSHTGWCYQIRRTWHGIVQIAMGPPISEGTNTLERQVWRTAFKDAIKAWQDLTGLEKGVWDSYSYPKLPAGYGRFIRWYLGEVRKEMPISPTVIIDHFDQAVHDKLAFTVSHVFTDIANEASVYFLIKCHASFDLHGIFAFDSEGDWKRRIYEDPTITEDGTQLTARNRNRDNGDTVNTTFYRDPTIGADGTLLVEKVMGASKDQAGMATTAEWILKKGKNYIVKMTNNAGANKDCSVRLMFTEES